MAEIEVPVICYWYGCIKDGPAGIYYEGSTLKMITVKRKTELSILLDQLYVITGLDRRRAMFDIIGRYPYPLSVEEWKVNYIPFPVLNDTSLKTMLEVPSKYPGIKSVELYLEVKWTSDGVIDPAACSSQPLANPGSSLKRQRADVFVKLERETDRNLGSDRLVRVVDLTGESSTSNTDSNSGVLKPCMSSLWLDDHDLLVGLCFKDGDELKKAVDWCSLKGQQKCIVGETAKSEYNFKCIRWKCKWFLGAVKMEKHGLFEIIRYTGPHTCRPTNPEELKSEFKVDEIERVVRVNPH